MHEQNAASLTTYIASLKYTGIILILHFRRPKSLVHKKENKKVWRKKIRKKHTWEKALRTILQHRRKQVIHSAIISPYIPALAFNILCDYYHSRGPVCLSNLRNLTTTAARKGKFACSGSLNKSPFIQVV